MLVDAGRLARAAGNAKAANVVIVGASAPYLPVSTDAIEERIVRIFAAKGEKVVDANLAAFRAGVAEAAVPAG